MRPRPSAPVRTLLLLAALASLLVFATLLASTSHAQDERELIPVLPAPPRIDPKYLRALDGPLTTTIADVAFRTSLGAQVRIPRLDIVAATTAFQGSTIEASTIHVVGLEVITPPDTITTGFDAFIEFPIPRVHIDRFVLEDGFIGALAHPSQYEGRWLWWQDDIDVEIRDLRLGGDAVEGLRLVRADFTGERRDRPLRVTAATGAVTRWTDVLEADISAALGTSEITTKALVRRSGAFDIAVAAEPLVFAEARAALEALPEAGSAVVRSRLSGDRDGVTIAVERAVARVLESTASVTGSIRTGRDGEVNDLVIEVPSLASADLDSLYGIALPGGGVWSGSVRANGPLGEGVAIEGVLSRTSLQVQRTDEVAEQPNGDGAAIPRFTIDGTYRNEPGAAIALNLEATAIPVREADAEGALRVSGPLDSLSVAGTLHASGARTVPEVSAIIDALIVDPENEPRLARATAELRGVVRPDSVAPAHEVAATLSGSAVLARDGRVDARMVTDPLPLAVLPLPEAIDSIRGDATADLTLTGTVDAPRLDGTVVVRDGSFRVRQLGLVVDALAGVIPIDSGEARLDGLAARGNGGRIDVRGTLTLTGDRVADVSVRADRVALLTGDSVRVLAFADARATGELTAPRIVASARLALPTERGGAELATVRGIANLADRTIELALRADSLPLDVLPPPEGVRDLQGAVRASVDVGGTIDEPTANGVVALERAGARWVRTGTELNGLRGTAKIRDGLFEIDSVTGTAGGGALTIDGAARLWNGPRSVDVTLALDSGRIVDTDSAQVVASADLRAGGPLARPHVEGTVALLEGWIHEDNFARRPAIDTLSPPYADLIDRVPWIQNSRLRRDARRPLATEAVPSESEADAVPAVRSEAPDDGVAGAEARDGPAFTARIALDVRPGISMIDEDSRLYGDGTIVVTADSGGVRAEGIYRVTGGYYAQYGEVFEVKGGAFAFAGDGVDPAISMRSVHRLEVPLGSWLSPGPNIFDRFPPLEFFAIGTSSAASEEVRRLALLPEFRTELAALLLYRERVQPVTGWRTPMFWPPDDGGGPFSVSSATRSTVLLWSWIANESYDYLPIERVYLRGGTIEAGPERPGHITVGRFMQGGVVLGPFHALVTQPLEAAAPGVRLHYTVGGPALFAFSEPRFQSVAPAFPLGRVFTHGRRTGVGIRWSWE